MIDIQQVENLEKTIDENIKNYGEAKFNYEKLNFKSNIIQLKCLIGVDKTDSYMYGDIKDFINCYVDSYDERAFGYYEINTIKIREKIKIVKASERIALLSHFLRKAKSSGYGHEFEWVEKEYKTEKIKYAMELKNGRDLFKLVFYCSTYNMATLFISIIILYLLYSLILLPAPSWGIVLFKAEYVTYSTNNLLNHFLNTILSFFEIESEFKPSPINLGGVLLAVCNKIVLFALVLGYLFEELKRKFES